MADVAIGGVGIRRWQVSTNGSIATNDLGTTIIQAGLDSGLEDAPYDVAVDRSNRIYTIQQTLPLATQLTVCSVFRLIRARPRPMLIGRLETRMMILVELTELRWILQVVM
jgi:hypothetical protein